MTEETWTWKRHVQALWDLSDEDLQIAFAGGRTDHPRVNQHDPVVKSILEERLLSHIGELTRRQTEAVGNVENAVKDLNTSSYTLERLTKKLNFLTVVLVVLTLLALVEPIMLEVWHFYRPEKEPGPPVIINLPPPPPPQMPTTQRTGK